MFDEILEQSSKFDAKFMEYASTDNIQEVIAKVAFDINSPHEDEHLRTPMTQELISELIGFNDQFIVDKLTVQYLHNKLFSDDLSVHGIEPGYWRRHSVKVGNHIPPEAVHLEYLMNTFFTQANKMTPTAMYRVFQTIHPFADGNGRVGGILLAVKSYLDSDGKFMLAPCQ